MNVAVSEEFVMARIQALTRQFSRWGKRQLIAAGIGVMIVALVLVATVTWVVPAFAGPGRQVGFPALITRLGAAPADSAVTTFKYDNFHTGADTTETTLTTKNVNQSMFGRRNMYAVDGQVYAEPLYIPNLTVNGAPHNVVFAATEHDSVYAFDADAVTPIAPLWHTSFLTAGVTSIPATEAYVINCCNVKPEIGITGTPVIDPSTGTLYVVAVTKEPGPTYVQRLHALDITTGQERHGSPVTIKASVPGTGAGSVNGVVSFSALHEFQRASLTLMNGVVYIPWASYGDSHPYHGWIIGYNAATLAQTAVFNDTPNGSDGGVWQAGSGPSADSSTGSLYFQTGNGSFDLSKGKVVDGGDTIYRLGANLTVQDSFTPFNQMCLSQSDSDLGSGGTLLLPPQPGAHPSELIGGGKEDRLYVVDRTHMGGYTSISNPCANQSLINVDKVVQEPHIGIIVGGVFSSPAYWQGPNGTSLFESGATDVIKAFPLVNGLISQHSSSKTPNASAGTGANVIVSSNGVKPGTGILWALLRPGVLYAYDATNLGVELYNTNQNAARDALPGFLHFTVPTVANGEVFLGSNNNLVIYGELTYNNNGISDDSATHTANYDGSGNSYSQQALTAVGLAPGAVFAFNGVKFTWPNIPSGMSDNYLCDGQTLLTTSPSGATTLAFLGSATNGPSTGTGLITYTDGTTQSFTLTLSDWTLNGGKSSPSAGNSIAATTTYRNTPTGKQARTTEVFYVQFSLAAGKTVQSVTLPTLVSQGHLHVFTLGFK